MDPVSKMKLLSLAIMFGVMGLAFALLLRRFPR